MSSKFTWKFSYPTTQSCVLSGQVSTRWRAQTWTRSFWPSSAVWAPQTEMCSSTTSTLFWAPNCPGRDAPSFWIWPTGKLVNFGVPSCPPACWSQWRRGWSGILWDNPGTSVQEVFTVAWDGSTTVQSCLQQRIHMIMYYNGWRLTWRVLWADCSASVCLQPNVVISSCVASSWVWPHKIWVSHNSLSLSPPSCTTAVVIRNIQVRFNNSPTCTCVYLTKPSQTEREESTSIFV